MSLTLLTLPGTATPVFMHMPGTVVRNKYAGATLTSGQVVYEDTTTGKCGVFDPTTAGLPRPVGVVVNEGTSNGQAVSVLIQGAAYGWDLSSNNPGDLIYADVSGGLTSTPPAERELQVGIVRASSQIDPNTNKLKNYIDFFFNPAAGGVEGKRIAKFAVGGTALHAGTLAWQNPEGATIIVDKIVLNVTTIATGACSVDIGTTATSATTQSDNLADGVDVHSATGAFSTIDQAGANGKERQSLAAGKWVTITQDSGDSTGLVANLYIEYFVA